jgi:flagellar secretion chaperone FliS
MLNHPYGAYLESRVLSASPLQLVHLAYEGAIDAIRDARAQLAEKRIQERVAAITKAQRIITELQTSLDYQKGGELSIQLGRLYDYMQRRLIEGNFQQSDAPFAEVQQLLETVDEGWRQIASTDAPLTADASVAAAATSTVASSPWMTSEASVYSSMDFTL